MKLWFLFRLSPAKHGETFSFVVRATSESKARSLASNNCGIEGPNCWLDKDAVSCERILATGDPHFLIRNTFCDPRSICPPNVSESNSESEETGTL